jgi:hypothetical protein
MTYFYTCHFYLVLFLFFNWFCFLIFIWFCLHKIFKKKRRRQGQQQKPLQSDETCTAAS